MLKGLVDRYLLALFGLLALAGLLAALPRGEGDPHFGAPLDSLSREIDGWVGVDGVPEGILPRDPKASGSVRRTYRRSALTVWVVVARYASGHDSQRRPSLNLIVPERGAISVDREVRTLALTDRRVPALRVNVISLRRPERQTSVVYWYQLGPTTIADYYSLRLQLFIDAVRSRRRGLGLVRLAMAGPGPQWPEEVLQAFYPPLSTLVSDQVRAARVTRDMSCQRRPEATRALC